MIHAAVSRKAGEFLFKFRSFTPLPLIVVVALCFKPHPWTNTKFLTITAAVFIILAGQLIRSLAVGFAGSGTSGRESFFRADSLNIDGLYSLVRNPLYIGNIFIYNGLLVLYGNWTAALLFNLFLIGQYRLIIASEEYYLRKRYGAEYDNYLQHVKRLMPRLTGYRKPQVPFNVKKVIFKENDSVFNWLFMLLLISLYKDFQIAGTGGGVNTLFYILSGGVLLFAYGCIKWVKKRVIDDHQAGGE